MLAVWVCEVVLGSAEEEHRITVLRSCKGLVFRIDCVDTLRCIILNTFGRSMALRHCFSNPKKSFAGCYIWSRDKDRAITIPSSLAMYSVFASINRPYYNSNVLANVSWVLERSKT